MLSAASTTSSSSVEPASPSTPGSLPEERAVSSAVLPLELAVFVFASTSALIDAYFAQFFAQRFGAALGMGEAVVGFSRYTALMTGLTSFALSRASLFKAVDTAKKIRLQQKAGLKISKSYALFVALALIAAIPSWQFAQDTAKTWPVFLALLFKIIQFSNIAAMNCRPLLETFSDNLLSEKYQSMALEIRRNLLLASRSLDVSDENFERLCAGQLSEKPKYDRYKSALKIFMLLAAPIYASSYYFATQTAVSEWSEFAAIFVALISFMLKTAFIWRTGFNLVDKIFFGMIDQPILSRANSYALPRSAQISLSVFSVSAGITTASASAGTLLKYLLPQVGFLGSETSLNGLIAALIISVCANSFSKIYDIDALLRNLVVKINLCFRHPGPPSIEENKQRLMAHYAKMPLSELLALHTELSPNGTDRVSVAELC